MTWTVSGTVILGHFEVHRLQKTVLGLGIKNHVGFFSNTSFLEFGSVIYLISDLDSKMPKIYLLQSELFPKLTNNGKVCFKVNSWQSHHSTRILLYKTWCINQDISGFKNVSHFYVFFDVILRNCRFRQAILSNPGIKILNAEPSPRNWHIYWFPISYFL